MLVGTRDTATRTISRSFAPAPLRRRAVVAAARHRRRGQPLHGALRRRVGHRYRRECRRARHRFGDRSGRTATNRYNSVLASWTSAPRGNFVNALSGSVSTFLNETLPVTTAPQLTFPSMQDGASFRMPQETRQTRAADRRQRHARPRRPQLQVRRRGAARRRASSGSASSSRAASSSSRTSPTFDHNGDGRIDDNDLLFAVTLRSGKPDQALIQPDADNTHVAGFIQDDWSVSNRLQLNLGLRYEIDTEVNNQSRVDELNPIVLPFVTGERQRDLNNFGPRVGFAWNATDRGLRRSRRLRHLLRPHRAADPVARARARRPRAPDRGARRQRLLPRSGDRTVPALRADASSNPVHRLRPARRRRIGHQHHRPAPAEPDRCTSSMSASSSAHRRHCARAST